MDALSGRRLNVLEQTVPIKITQQEDAADLRDIKDAHGLSAHLCKLHQKYCSGTEVDVPACVLLTAGPVCTLSLHTFGTHACCCAH